MAVADDIGHLADVVVHVSTGEEQHSDDADTGPEFPILDDRQDIWIGDCTKSEHSQKCCHDGHDTRIIDRARQRGIFPRWQMAQDPSIHRFRRVVAAEIIPRWLSIRLSIDANGRREEKQDWRSLEL